MIGVYREFEGCMRLAGHVLRRLPVLREIGPLIAAVLVHARQPSQP
jgi:hypothetical protein